MQLQFVWVLTLLASCLALQPPADWVNTEFKRTLDLSKSYVKEKYQLTIKNIADSPIDTYYFALPNYVFDKISGFSVTSTGTKEALSTELLTELTEINGEPLINYIKVQFPQPVSPKSTYHLNINLIISDFISPLPAAIGLNEDQTLLLRTFKKPISAYKTFSNQLFVTGIGHAQELAIEGHQIEDSGAVEDNSLKYEFQEVEPLTISSFPLVYSHQGPLPKIIKLDRSIWVSHWGNSVEFEEYYELTNIGAEIKGGFSRADFMKSKQAIRTPHVLTVMELNLNKDSHDVYYTDLVGNVSTSRVFSDKIYIRPRYPIFGKWHYNFTLGWTNQLNQFLDVIKSEDIYSLTVPLLNGPTDATYDKVNLSFYLPEGAKVLEINSPIQYESIEEGYELSYFDLGNGHTKVTLTFTSLVDELNVVGINIKYRYTTWNLLQKPFNIAKLLFVALLSYFLLTKIDVQLKAKK